MGRGGPLWGQPGAPATGDYDELRGLLCAGRPQVRGGTRAGEDVAAVVPPLGGGGRTRAGPAAGADGYSGARGHTGAGRAAALGPGAALAELFRSKYN